MGSLLTEGDHLHLDRSRTWKPALRKVIQAAQEEAETAGAANLVLRDLPEDPGLHDFLIGEGLFRIPVHPTWRREVDFTDDAGFLAGLTRKHRYHQRNHVLPWEGRFRIARYGGGTPEAASVPAAEVDRFHELYSSVHSRSFDLNVFPLPRHLLDTILASPGWELVVLHPVEDPRFPVAFVAQHVAAGHLTPVFVGLDYAYVGSHHSYQVLLLQALRGAVRRGAERVHYGMSADLQNPGSVRWRRHAGRT